MTTEHEFKAHAQIQKSSRGETVTFQPDDLFCDGCWDLRETAYVNAMIAGGRAYSRVVKADGEKHGMRAEIEKETDMTTTTTTKLTFKDAAFNKHDALLPYIAYLFWDQILAPDANPRFRSIVKEDVSFDREVAWEWDGHTDWRPCVDKAFVIIKTSTSAEFSRVVSHVVDYMRIWHPDVSMVMRQHGYDVQFEFELSVHETEVD